MVVLESVKVIIGCSHYHQDADNFRNIVSYFLISVRIVFFIKRKLFSFFLPTTKEPCQPLILVFVTKQTMTVSVLISLFLT